MLQLKKWKQSSPIVVSQPKEVSIMEQIHSAEEMEQKCIREARKAATNGELLKAETYYHEARAWHEVQLNEQYGYRYSA